MATTTATTNNPPPPPRTHRSVVSSFLTTGTPHTPSFRLSIFKRSAHVGVYQNLWAACSGSIDPSDASPLAAALREIKEETSIPSEALTLIGRGEAYEVFDEEVGVGWMIWPFMFRVEGGEGNDGVEVTKGDLDAQGRVLLDWEHTEVRFVRVEEVEGFETVAHLGRSLRRAMEGVVVG